MDTLSRLSAAQTARAAAKRAFNAAVEAATHAAIARKLRTVAEIDAAVEADPAVIAARAASAVAIAELEAAEAAMRADAAVSQDDRMAASTAGAHAMARAMTDGDRPDPRAHTEADPSEHTTPTGPMPTAARDAGLPPSHLSAGTPPITLTAQDVAELTPSQAGALADVLRAYLPVAYQALTERPTWSPGMRDTPHDHRDDVRGHDMPIYWRVDSIKSLLMRRARETA